MHYMGKDIDKPCECEEKKLAYRLASHGVRMYTNQCQRCGRLSSWIKKATLTRQERENAPEIDDGIGDAYREALRGPVREQYEKRLEDQRHEYSMYLNSIEWARKRRRRMEMNKAIFGGLCEICFERQAEQCHHVTYQRVRREWIFDLACLCRECHEEIHNIQTTEKP